MAERFERLYKLPDNLYVTGSPVIISAGALLKDNETGNIVTQLKFHSVSEKRIIAVKISVTAYDVSGKELQGVEDYQYLDLNVYNGQYFGSNKAIVMPEIVTRSFEITAITVIFDDQFIWKWDNTDSFKTIPTQESLYCKFGNADLVTQYQLDTNKQSVNVPIVYEDLWICACGNATKGEICTNCHSSKNKMFSLTDKAVLEENLSCRIALEKAAMEEKARKTEIENRLKAEKAEKELAKKAIKKKAFICKLKVFGIILSACAVFALLISFWIYPNFIKPANQYAKAEELCSTGEYLKAKSIFEALGDYKDSSERVNEMITFMMNDIYEAAVQCMQDKDYKSAIEYFKSLGDYKDSINQIELCESAILKNKYNDALSFMKSGKYREAIDEFEELDGYMDSGAQKAIAESKYYCDLGKTHFQSGKFYLAINCFKKSSEESAKSMITKAESEITYIQNTCGSYIRTKRISWGEISNSTQRETCEITYDFDEGKFIFDNSIFVDEHQFSYQTDRTAKYEFKNSYLGGKDYYYKFENDILLRWEDENNYEYYKKQ